MYDGSVIGKYDVIVVPDSENTLMHAKESQSNMIEKQNDPQMIEKKVITKPIDYAILNQLSTDFNTRFMQQTESYAEQAFWSQYSVQTDEPNHSGTTIVEVPKELLKVSMKVNTKPVDYAALNQLSQDFETRFVPQTDLSAEQVFWSQNSVNSKEPNLSTRPTQV
uniref:Uncharacterized protein n=1 Tax=Tanacetum cinerariifolium TaxID=118510 RepID=A0A699JAC8_TANCI|nr:hypothetical protein [Tanacetum cinerariifolium]